MAAISAQNSEPGHTLKPNSFIYMLQMSGFVRLCPAPKSPMLRKMQFANGYTILYMPTQLYQATDSTSTIIEIASCYYGYIIFVDVTLYQAISALIKIASYCVILYRCNSIKRQTQPVRSSRLLLELNGIMSSHRPQLSSLTRCVVSSIVCRGSTICTRTVSAFTYLSFCHANHLQHGIRESDVQ